MRLGFMPCELFYTMALPWHEDQAIVLAKLQPAHNLRSMQRLPQHKKECWELAVWNRL